MPRTRLHELADLGQSIWLDFINRDLLTTGKLQKWIDDGLRGMTSNPSIFNQVISQGTDYDAAILKLKEQGKSTFEIYDELTIKDIQDATDFFKPVYEKTDRLDGYVSLEINPQLAHDTEASIKEGRRLFKKVGRPNVMIKVPATDEGFPVIEELLAEGINVNVTLIFSRLQYERTVEAYLRGLERLSQIRHDLSDVRSVASVFVSRIDTSIDHTLRQKLTVAKSAEEKESLNQLLGKAAVANSTWIYTIAQDLFASERFQELVEKGAAVQRVLWGSTSTKDPQYRDVKYVEEMIARDTVNTVPEKTLKAFMDHGIVQETLRNDTTDAQHVFNQLAHFQINIDAVCLQLLKDGVLAFDKSFEELTRSIEDKAQKLCGQAR
ncbi:MAG: transaldolase [Candidatus Omnitrophica bacterium]|nr:transaldolase [Candidatus Omnitrophota bacterium]